MHTMLCECRECESELDRINETHRDDLCINCNRATGLGVGAYSYYPRMLISVDFKNNTRTFLCGRCCGKQIEGKYKEFYFRNARANSHDRIRCKCSLCKTYRKNEKYIMLPQNIDRCTFKQPW